MTDYLTRKKASPALVRRVLARLRDWGYLNDGAFAARWAEARLARRPMGRARLEAELRAKGFDEETVRQAVAQAFHEKDEADLARVVVARRPRGERRGPIRAAAVLRRYGFTDDTIEEVLGAED
jgi:regulatory protein